MQPSVICAMSKFVKTVGKQQPIPAKGSCYLFTVAGSTSIVIVESPLAKLAGWLMHE